jgi:anti-sigma B factor antagonist
MAELKSREYEAGVVKVLELSGPITMGSGDITVRDLIKGMIEKGNRQLVIDLGKVPNVDSTGIGELVASFTSAKNRGATLKLANLTHKVKDLLTITRLTSVFESYDSVDEAVSSYR